MECLLRIPWNYPDIAILVADAVARGRAERGILICGTDILMAITANKVPRVRAAKCHDVYSAERARKSNMMGSRVVGPETANKVVGAWLSSEFGGGKSTRKVAKIDQVDARYRKL
jgi:ribose 5-phosphate isomerase B